MPSAAGVTLSSVDLGVVGVFAPVATLDALTSPAASTALRVAPDELALIGAPDATATVLGAAEPAAAAGGGFALDLSDGWTTWRLHGDVEQAFSYLSELHLPLGGVIQGDVLRVPVRVIRNGDTLDLLVPSPWGIYLRDEVIEALAGIDLSVETTVRA